MEEAKMVIILKCSACPHYYMSDVGAAYCRKAHDEYGWHQKLKSPDVEPNPEFCGLLDLSPSYA